MRNLRIPCKAPSEVNGRIPTFRCPTNPQKGELTIASGVRDSFLMLRKFDVWFTLCENNEEFCMPFTARFTHKTCVQKWLCRRGNDRRTSETSSEDVHEGRPEDAKSTPFRLCEFCNFWLRYTTLNGNILRVSWQMVQRCLNLVMKRWKLAWEARIRSCKCSLSKVDESSGKNRPASTGKRAPRFDDFSPLIMLYEDCIACNVQNMMTS